MSYTRKPRGGRCNGKKKNKLKTVKRALDAFDLYMSDMSQGRIAEKLGISQPAVSQILKRTLESMHFDLRDAAQLSLVKELERCRQYAEANMTRAKKDPRVADTLLRWMERQDKLLGLGITKHDISGTINHTTNLGFDLYTSEELEVLEFLIAKGSGLPSPFPDKRVCLVPSDPMPALTYDPQPVETFTPDDDIPLTGEARKLQ